MTEVEQRSEAPDAQAELGLGEPSKVDAGKGCRHAVHGGGPGSDKRLLMAFVIDGPTWGERYFSLDVDSNASYAAALEEPLVRITLPAREACARRSSDADVASFERAVHEADVCAYPVHSTTPLPPDPGFSLSDPRFRRWRQGRWDLFLCTDFGEECSIQRRADEWASDPKLKRLLAAIEALVRATCR